MRLASIHGRCALLASVGIVAAGVSLAVANAADPTVVSPKVMKVDTASLLSASEIQSWLDQKDSWGPAYTAGPGWKKFMAFIHAETKSLGMVNVQDIPFPYTRWYTTEFPDKSGWSFVSDGTSAEVASYGTQSGSTGPQGVTAAMVLYDLTQP